MLLQSIPGRLVIRCGGQTGVDRAALEVATVLGLGYCGWCPKGGLAEDVTRAPGVRARYPFLIQTPSTEYEQRTAWNVRDSHATLILSSGDETKSPGTAFTRVCAELIFLRPTFVARINGGPRVAAEVRRWLTGRMTSGSAQKFVLNITGPRESEVKGIKAEASRFIRDLLTKPTPIWEMKGR